MTAPHAPPRVQPEGPCNKTCSGLFEAVQDAEVNATQSSTFHAHSTSYYLMSLFLYPYS